MIVVSANIQDSMVNTTEVAETKIMAFLLHPRGLRIDLLAPKVNLDVVDDLPDPDGRAILDPNFCRIDS